ncbi:thioesterase II family protein [Paractinoplanes atraurantiacus]|uniref:Surfactin synthase thioesterase subunit n=1 Tax=Paractinoplanes atraurantiacus TaxID=1036182 RepID=A0A285GLG3_9ACTN|nr:alpha/beta fold hydrolase [Actinoplanes atraurantiacus]SNY24407.1 Surfactin synthase thioesterase subunit [Actinoplanes atraurantiacus]
MTAWLSVPPSAADAPVRLLCFAHAGGGAGFFQPWRPVLAPEVAVCPVVLPGRETRVREEPYRRVEDLLGPLVDGLGGHLDRPYAILGHSMGAVLAYEVARRLTGAGAAPLCLFVSGRRAPRTPTRRPALHRLPEDEFLRAVGLLNGTPPEVLAQGDVIKLFLPSLRADFELNEVYAPLPGPPLDCPVSALTGDADPEVNLDEIAAWRETTRGAFTLRVFRGDHFYLKGAPPEVLAAIRADLRRLGAATAQTCADSGALPPVQTNREIARLEGTVR